MKNQIEPGPVELQAVLDHSPYCIFGPHSEVWNLRGLEDNSAHTNLSQPFSFQGSQLHDKLSWERSYPAEPGIHLVLYKLVPPWIGMHLWLLNIGCPVFLLKCMSLCCILNKSPRDSCFFSFSCDPLGNSDLGQAVKDHPDALNC